ncbi:MAG: hypothetical protein K2Q20_14880 [Phycisphaerales bacterium]|nr:hypothetical protein [Phycisphaerales bacterium]
MIKTRSIVAVLSAAAVTASGAMATTQFSPVLSPPSGERGHAFILGQTYGGSFTRSSNGVDFSNGTVTAQRLVDKGVAAPASLTSFVSGLPTDNTWVGPALSTLKVEAKYAGHNSTFGFFNDSSSSTAGGALPTLQSLFNTGSIGSTATVNMPANFRWALKNNTTGKTFTSRAEDNVEGNSFFDHLVTYRITGAGDAPGAVRYMLFWEDLTIGDCTDMDYNDAVIQVTAIPAPGATALLAGAGLLASRRRRR